MLDNKLLSIFYSILIPYVVLFQICSCTHIKDSYLEATSSPEYLLYNNLYPVTLKSYNANIVNKEKYDDNIELNIRKISNEEINRNTANTNNLLQSNTIQYPIENEEDTYNKRKKYNEEDKFGFNVLSTTKSYNSQDMVANHRKYLHLTFEKHKAQSLKSTQYNQEHKIDRINRNNISHDNQNYHNNNNNNSQPRETKINAFQTTLQQNEPYYHNKLYYNGDKKSVENNPFTLYSQFKKSHKNPYFEKYHHHNHHNHHHHHHHPNLNKQNHHNNKWPYLSRIQSEFYYDENNGQIDEDLLPPYIKKYNRRNKQLKNLLEGTIPITLSSSVISSQYQNRKQHHHHHHHNHNQQNIKSIEYFGKIKPENLKQHLRNHKKNPKWIIENLFEEQRANPNNPNSNNNNNNNNDNTDNINDSPTIITKNSTKIDIDTMLKENNLPDDSNSAEHYDNYDYNDENISTVNKSYIGIVNKNLDKEKISQNYNFKDSFKPKTFIYHRVDDPRIVGAGDTGKKQRLPFVAITDRRLETSKKLQHNQPTNFELNNFPLP